MPVNQTYTKWMQIEFYNMTILFCIFLHPCTSSRFKVYTMTIKQFLFFIRQWNKTRESWRKRNASTYIWDKSTSTLHTWSICFLSYQTLYILYVDTCIWIYIYHCIKKCHNRVNQNSNRSQTTERDRVEVGGLVDRCT